MKRIMPHNVLIEKEAEKDSLTFNVIKNINNINLIYLKDKANHEDLLRKEKSILYLTHYRGDIIKPCPGTPSYICCGYKIINIGINCPLNCSYCILQAYINQPFLRIYSNINDRLNEIEEYLNNNTSEVFRFGTGEFTDSLALDHLTEWSRILIPFISKIRNASLEFKTKTDNINGVLKLPYRDRIIISWSLNTKKIVSREEKGTASLRQRILSAKKCQEHGFVVGFHFDPLILYEGWERDFKEVIDMIDKEIDPSRVIWISLGSMRFMPELKDIIHKRYPESRALDGEFIKGLDGKYRYFKPIRIDMYAYAHEILREWSDKIAIYLCMESNEVWKKSFGWSPGHSHGLKEYLDNRLIEVFKINI